MFYEWGGLWANNGLFILTSSPRLATFSLLTTWLIQTEGASENDWHLQWKKYFTDRYKEYFINPLFVEKVEQKPPQGEICGVVTCRR